MKKMETTAQEGRFLDTTEVQFEGIMTHGNLLEFKLPVNMHKPNYPKDIRIDDLERAIIG